MRILIATSHRNMVGGAEKYLREILPSLVEGGHELAILYEFRFDPSRERIDPLELGLPSRGIAEAGFDAALRFVRDWKPDVVYSQGLESAHLQSVLLNEYPAVFYAHNYVGTCVSGEKCHAFPKPRPCDRRFGPACLALYFPRRCGGLHPGTMWKMYQRAVDRNAQLREYAAILVAGEHMRREYQRHGVEPQRIHVAPLPNPNAADLSRKFQSAESRSRLLFLGRLTKLKGVAELLRAIPLAEKKLGKRLPITVAGDGPERARLEEFAARNQIMAEFTGWVADGRKRHALANSDLLVVPSLWPEPFGLVGVEAGARGLPAVAYDVGGISGWLIPGYSGELAPGDPPTIDGLAEAIHRALSDSAHYADLCRGAREVAGRFTLAAHISKLENTLHTVLETVRCAPSNLGSGAENIHVEA